ncbi:hypothetical protein CDAR_212551 [Caerostris darwini]|uniref:Uncharacterized protein n=1 Tax=Caerostris darwini TaxID=1538125 RepID=A0AAV4Q098_9ARAC|nr:hypothetical protein CDAR_212551 [Caerostris darwini]
MAIDTLAILFPTCGPPLQHTATATPINFISYINTLHEPTPSTELHQCESAAFDADGVITGCTSPPFCPTHYPSPQSPCHLFVYANLYVMATLIFGTSSGRCPADYMC